MTTESRQGEVDMNIHDIVAEYLARFTAIDERVREVKP